MIVDARELPPNHVIEADVAVIGAGAAGITLAVELERTGLSVAVLESGGLSIESDIQDLNSGTTSGTQSPPLVASRLRLFGGTTNHWTGQCGPLDAIDFERRPGVTGSGWPISRDALAPFYERAATYCELGGFIGFDGEEVRRRRQAAAFGLDASDFENIVYQLSPPTRFGSRWGPQLEASTNVTVYLYATVTELLPAVDGDHIREVTVARPEGDPLPTRAGNYVLAGGAIENTRLLLASNSVRPAGLGNENDLVGRFFMDHLNVGQPGEVVFGRPEAVDLSFYTFFGEQQRARGALRIPDGRLEELGLLNAGILFFPVPVNENFRDRRRGSGEQAFVELTRSLARGSLPEGASEQVCAVVRDRREVLSFLRRRAMRIVQDAGGTASARLQVEAEQSPNPESRVTIGRERDAYGVPRPHLHWQLTSGDFESILRTMELFGSAVGSAGLGRYRMDQVLEPGETPVVSSAWHHVGTTRMSSSPSEGVVNADCRLHSASNLYVAGSSVFPTVGRTNPTLTIVAMAIRLADHLAARGARP